MSAWPEDTPWRQGHILSRDDAQALGLRHPDAGSEDDTVVVVVSHDCDLILPPETDRDVEVIIGREIEAAEGNRTFAKGPRILHLPFSEGEHKIIVELDARNKTSVEKERFGSYTPSAGAKLSVFELHVLQHWLGLRYNRASFPNAFNDRLKKVEKQLDKILKAKGSNLLAVYVDVDHGEEHERKDPKNCYALEIYLVHTVEPDIAKSAATANEAAAAIEKAFAAAFTKDREIIEIELRGCNVVSEVEMSLYAVRRLKRLYLDHLSLRASPPGALPRE